MNLPYISGTGPPPKLPLGRFLPPLPSGMVARWCQENLAAGDWLLDPFGFSPLCPLEAVAAGFNMLVTANNPIHAFTLKVLSSAPHEEELVAALQDLATAPRGEARMEDFIRDLYRIRCGSCGQDVEVEAFLWQKGSSQPFAAEIDCLFCGSQGEQVLDTQALESIPPLPPEGLHRSRALNRIASINDPLRENVEQTLNVYPSRPLIILQSIINRLNSLDQAPRRKELLTALILSVADQANTLWGHPTPRERPKQLITSSAFRECNIWKALEAAVKTWQVIREPIPFFNWHTPQETDTEEPAIYCFSGRVKDLAPSILPERLAGIVTVIPRPNQAFWSLSALWTGWIWGQEAVLPIRQVLARQRYDWNWHTNALASVFESIASLGNPVQLFWGLVAENEPMLLLSALLGANISGFNLSGFAQSEDDQLAQCLWGRSHIGSPTIKPNQAHEKAKTAARSFFEEKGEPASYQQVHAAMLTGLAHQNELAMEVFLQNRNQSASETQKLLEGIFREPALLAQVGEETASLETADFWLNNPQEPQPPLIDRIEEQIVRLLVSEDALSSEEIRTKINLAFPGLFTPSEEMVLNCLESYADRIDEEGHLWHLDESETPEARRKDIAEIRGLLRSIGQRLGYQVIGQDPIFWHEGDESHPQFSFHVFSSAMIWRHLYHPDDLAEKKMMVLPGSRANLLAFKKQRDPVLKERMDRCCLEVKFRLVRDLAPNPLLSRALFIEQIKADPPEYHASQLALF